MIEKVFAIKFLIFLIFSSAPAMARHLLGRLLKPKPEIEAGKFFLEIEAQRRRHEELALKHGFGTFQIGYLPHRPPLPRPRDELHELGTINRLSEAQRRRDVENSLFAESLDEPIKNENSGGEIYWGEVKDELKKIGDYVK